MKSIQELREYLEDYKTRYSVDYDKVLEELTCLQKLQIQQILEILDRLDLIESYALNYVPDPQFLQKLLQHTNDSIFTLQDLIQPDEETDDEPPTDSDGA